MDVSSYGSNDTPFQCISTPYGWSLTFVQLGSPIDTLPLRTIPCRLTLANTQHSLHRTCRTQTVPVRGYSIQPFVFSILCPCSFLHLHATGKPPRIELCTVDFGHQRAKGTLGYFRGTGIPCL
jgi:hypothetical protein